MGSGDAQLDGETSVVASDLISTIAGRVSTRSGFTPERLSDDVIVEIVKCGLAAPSSKNAKPWKFHVVTDARILQGIADDACLARGLDEYVPTDAATGRLRPWDSSVAASAETLRAVQTAIFIENRGVFSSGKGALVAAEKNVLDAALVGYTFEVVGLGAAIQNMLLAAHSLDIGAAFMGDLLIVEEMIANLLGIEGDLVGVIALGYSDESSDERTLPELDPSLVSWSRPTV